MVAVAILFLALGPVSVSRAEAFNPLEMLFKISKKAVMGTGSIPVYNQIENQAKEPVQTKPAAKKIAPEIKVDPKDIEREAEFASKVTGIRKDFLMGSLVMESKLGQNIGGCTYKEVEFGARDSYQKGLLGAKAWETFKSRQRIIKDLAEDLGYNYEDLKVSCNPPASLYAGTGGALGVPQFMPDTWLEYKDRIAVIVGKENPDPWDVRDGVVAMALKLSDVPGVSQHNVWSERNASKLYLSGTTSWRYDWYANEIQYWARNYFNLIG